jgi:hypothetical protein
VGVFALAVPLAAKLGLSAAGAVMAYIGLVVALTLLAGALLLYPIGILLGGMSPTAFVALCAPAQAVAFASRSSLAALPAMVESAQRVKMPPVISGFILPLAASVFRVGGAVAMPVGVLFVARLYGMPDAVGATRTMVKRLGLDGREEQLAGELSGGWKQRLALAACVLHQPELLLLDEPTAGVDPNARREFWEMIHELAASGVTILVSTHYMDEAERCHRIAYLAWGKLLLVGSVDEVVARSGLTTWEVTGPDLVALQHQLKGRSGIDMVAAFGTALHVTGTDPAGIEAGIAPFRTDPRYAWAPAPASLEDVFIHTLARAGGNGHRP